MNGSSKVKTVREVIKTQIDRELNIIKVYAKAQKILKEIQQFAVR